MYKNFLLPLSDLYKIPGHINKEEYLENVARDLQGFNDTVLQMAFQHMRKTRKYTTMPAIADMIKTCEQMQSAYEASKNQDRGSHWQKAKEKEEATVIAWSPQRKQLARQKLQDCAHAKRAAEEGWISWLYDHYRYNDRSPTRDEITAMIESFEGDQNSRKDHAFGVRMYAEIYRKRDELKQELTDLVLYGVIKGDAA